MIKIVFQIILFFTLVSCKQGNKVFITKPISQNLIDSRNYALRNGLDEVMASDSLINDTLTKLFRININDNHFKRFVSKEEFTYFVIDGWKGSTFGILLTRQNKLENIFYDLNKIETEINDSTFQYFFASSKVY